MKTLLFEIRLWLGLGQRALASALGLSKSNLTMAENGQRSLSPNHIHFLLELHKKLAAMPADKQVEQQQKECLQQKMIEVEAELDYLQALEKQQAKNQKHLPGPEMKQIEDFASLSFEAFDTGLTHVAHFLETQRDQKRNMQMKLFEKALELELKITAQRTVLEVLRKKYKNFYS